MRKLLLNCSNISLDKNDKEKLTKELNLDIIQELKFINSELFKKLNSIEYNDNTEIENIFNEFLFYINNKANNLKIMYVILPDDKQLLYLAGKYRIDFISNVSFLFIKNKKFTSTPVLLF